MLWSLAFIAVGVYLGLGALLFATQARMIFQPRREFDALPSEAQLQFTEASFAATDGVQLHGWLIAAAVPARGTILFCHGNAGNISHCLEVAQLFVDLGWDVLLFDYRGYGQSQGQPSEAGIYCDAAGAWRWLVGARGVAPGQIVIVGRSLGGAPAAWLASQVQPAPRALVLESVFSSAPDMAAALYPVFPRALTRVQLPTVEFVREVRVPVLVLHSREDEIVPYRLGRQVFEAANAPKEFGELRGDHNGCYFLDATNYRHLLETFLAPGPGE